VKAELREEMADLKTELLRQISELGSALRQEMAAMGSSHIQATSELGSTLRQEMAQANADLRKEIAESTARLIRWMFAFWTGTVVTLLGAMFAIARL
jgi:hypothetical protein